MSKKSLKVNEPKEHWKAVVAARSRESARYLPESRPDPLLLDSADRLNSPEQQRDEVLPDFTQPYRDLLPNSILELANQSGYAAVFLQENLEVVYNVSTFLYRTEFPGKLPFRPFRGGELFCDPERRKDALKLVFPTPKPTKKMFKYGKMVGEGGFGVVMCARAKVIPKGAGTTSPSGKKVKVKEVAVKKLIHSTSKQQKQNFDELGFLATLAHPNIVNFYYALHVKENTDESGAIVEELWLVTEFLLGGTLDQASTYKAWPQNSVAFVAWQILSALEYLHSQNIAHRDLKSTNVMMSVKGEIKLIDFGLCCDFQSGPRTQILGTSHWIPPEMIKGVPHSLPVDIWSLGVCILELFILGPPHKDNTFRCMVNAATVGLDDQIPIKHPQLTAVGQDFIKACLTVDPTKRPSAKQLLKHDFITKNAKEDKGGIVKILATIFVTKQLSSSPSEGAFLF